MFRWKRKGCVHGRRRGCLHLEVLEDRTLFSVNLLTSFKGLNTNDAGGFVEPPDTIAAAGPSVIIEEVNSNIAIYNKADGHLIASTDLGTFFSSVDTAQSLFSDVNVTYDEESGRFLVSTMDIDFGTNAAGTLASYFDFAISNTSYPADLSVSSWTEMHQIETDEVSPRTGEQLFTDFPRLGWNADAYVVAFNMFGFETEYQYNVQLLTIDKSSVLDQNPATLTTYRVDRPLPNSTMVPAVMHGSAPGDPMWFVEEKGLEQDGSYADLRVVKMTNVLSANPTFTDYYVPMDAYTITPFPQDTAGRISFVLDTRILNVDWRNNQMAIAQDVGMESDINVHARWYEISTAGAAPTMVQQGTLNPGPGVDTYMPSVALATDGSIGMTYIESSAKENMSMYVTGRAASDPLGTMQDGVLVKAGEDVYEGGLGQGRIGDFSGISVDPTDGTTFWAANEYAINANGNLLLPNWGTYIGHFNVDSSAGLGSPVPTGNGLPSSPRPGAPPTPPGDDNLGRSRGRLLLQHPPAGTHRGNGGRIVGSGPSGGPSPLLVSTGVSFHGLNTNDAGGFVEPPDTIAAAGPSVIIEEVNSNIAIYDKADGHLISSTDLGSFFSSVDSAQSLFSDVNVTYDEESGRFLVSTMDIDFGTSATGQLASYFDFAISNTSYPADLSVSSWTEMHQIETDEVSPRTGEQLFTDFPRLGWNADAYFIAFNMFGFETEYQYNVQLLTIDKSSVLDQDPKTLTTYHVDRPLPNSTMVPAVMHGSSPGDPMWFVEEKGLEQDGSYADLRVVKMTNVLSANPTFTDYYVPMDDAYTITPFPQDTAGRISFVLDTRILNVDWRNNQMVIAQDVGMESDINVHARWYEISTAGAAPTMVQQGTLNPGPGVDTYMPSVALATDGSIGMTYIESSASENMSMYVTGRAASDPLGTMQDGVVKAGEDVYEGGLGQGRIGDFSGISVDPTDGTTFWAANEYAINANGNLLLPNWGTWIASFVVTPLTVSGGSISGTVINDLNGDGMDENDPGFNGVTVDLFDAGHNLVDSTVTAIGLDGLDGEYSFANLPAGDYTVVEEVPSGWIATAATSLTAMVVDGQDTGGLDFFNFQLVTISGTVFNDLNGDGVQEAGEPGVQNWAVDLMKGGVLVKAILTDASGNFSFTNLGPGTFTIQEEQEPGWLETSTPTTYSVTTNSGTNVSGEAFGNFQTMRISGTVFNDLNGDGVQETGEPGLQGWTVDLIKGQSKATRKTDANGNFTFVGVGPGTFTVQEELQTGWIQTSTPATYSVTTMSGTNIMGAVFGNIAPATHFSVSLPASTTAGAAFSFTITALDAFNNTAVGYQGTVTFSSSDPKRILPANYKFTNADAGVHVFSATLRTAGSQSITASDTVNSTISGSSSVTVNPAAPYKLAIGRFPYKPTAGVAGSFRVTIQDRYSNTINVAPYFTDTVSFTSSDPKAVLPADYTFTPPNPMAPNPGVQDFIATLYTAGTQSITVRDMTNPTISSASIPDILLQPAATSQLVVSGFPSSATAGVSYPFTVTAEDPYNNITPAYQGTVHFMSTDQQAVLPADYTFTGNTGVHMFAATLNSTGQQSIMATDTADVGITGSESMIMVFLMQPTVTVSGQTVDLPPPTVGVPGQLLTYTLNASEPGVPDGTAYSYSVQWEKGGPTQNYSGSSITQASHIYATPGSYTITVTATDQMFFNVSPPVSVSVSIAPVAMETDPYDPTQTALYIGGTLGDDTIAITPATQTGGVKVGMNLVSYGSFFPTGHVVVYSQSGTDIIKTAAQTLGGKLTYVNVPVLFLAGNGNDILNVSGSSANNVLVGGGGTDRLIGGLGEDILIGGAGQAKLEAGAGGDILIGGTTAYDNNAAALAALLAEWSRTDVDFATRRDHLTGRISGGLNGNFLLITKMGNANTVFDNGLADKLYGGAGMDWFFAGMADVLVNNTNGDFVTPI